VGGVGRKGTNSQPSAGTFEGITDFFTSAQLFAPFLLVAFPWLMFLPMIHALTHHAPAFLPRIGSLESHADQAVEAWHAFFTNARAQCTADSFLWYCAQLVQRAAVEQ